MKNRLLIGLSFSLGLSAQMAQASSYVVIGDSHSCGAFGQQFLKDKFGSSQNTVTLYCAVSSAPVHWLKGIVPPHSQCQTATSAQPLLKPCRVDGSMITAEQILKQQASAAVVVALGTNSLMSSDVPASYKQLADLAAQNGRPCFWIAPPHLNPAQSKGFPEGRVQTLEDNLNLFYENLTAQVQTSCHLIDSRPSTEPNSVGYQTVDGVHRTPTAGVYWAQEVSKGVR